MRWWRHGEWIVVGSISLFIVILSLFQLFVYLFRTPLGFVYPLVHNYEADFYWYLSLMRQGWEGNFLVTTRYTPEQFAPQFVNTFFPILGMAARLVGASLSLMYTLARVVGGMALLLLGYWLARTVFPEKEKRWIAFFFMILGAPFWFIQGGRIVQVGEFWTGFDPMLRVTFLPHHLFANCLVIVAMLFFSRGVNHRQPRLILGAGIAAALAGWLNPGSLVVLLLAVGIASLIRLKVTVTRWQDFSLFFLIAMLPFLWLYQLQNSVFPWTAFRDWERLVQYPVTVWSWFGVLGVPGILALVGIPTVLKKKDYLWDVLVGWFFAPIVGILFSSVLPFSNGRFLQGAAYIPTAILAVVGAQRVLSILYQVLRKKISFSTCLAGRRVWHVVFAIVCLIVVLPSLYASVARQLRYVETNRTNPLVYMPKQVMDEIKLLGAQAQADDVVLAPLSVSTLIPAFTNKRVLVGHPTFTYKAEEKLAAVDRWYHGERMVDMLSRYNVRWVWTSESFERASIYKAL